MRKGFIGSPARAAFRLVLLVVTVLASLTIYLITKPVPAFSRQIIFFLFHRLNCRIAGLRVEVRGRINGDSPTLFVSNHISYFDIPVLGSLIAGSFVAKSEVATWPLIGGLAKLQRTVFVERDARRAAGQRKALLDRLELGENLILFPEGTSSDGNRVLPFKSSLFAVAEAPLADSRAIAVQAVSIAYTKLDSMPMGRTMRPFLAWYGDMDLVGHLWQALGLGTVSVVVEFHPPTTIAEFGCRKALSEHCHRQSAAGLAAALTDRAPASLGLMEEGLAA